VSQRVWSRFDSIDVLEGLLDRILDVETWDDLLSDIPKLS
jgi:hypothetical protein